MQKSTSTRYLLVFIHIELFSIIKLAYTLLENNIYCNLFQL